MTAYDRHQPDAGRPLAIEHVATAGLRPNPRNARTHSKKQVKAIAESIKAFGFTNPVLIDEGGMILAGHGRAEAAKLLGLDQVPTVRIADLSEAQKRAYVLADNKLAERAGWDRELLAVELGELSVMLPDLDLTVDLTGFEAGEIDVILADTQEDEASDPDDDPTPVEKATVSRLGDLWALGRHRLLHGDARDPHCGERLMGDERADMAFLDAPYNVRIAGHVLGNGKRRHAEFAMASGEMTDAEFLDFLQATHRNAAAISRNGAVHFTCMDWRHLPALFAAGSSVYGELLNLAVWVKANWGLGGFYRSQHELVAVYRVGEAQHTNNIELGRHGRTRSNVWEHAGFGAFKAKHDEELAVHPTVKPVGLVADAIKDVTRRGNLVLDVFGGSGTTLIAAERTARRGRLMEIDARYVDATIRRFEKLTHLEAVHVETGRTFADIAHERAGASVH